MKHHHKATAARF